MGPGASNLTVSGGNATRVITVTASGVMISGLTIANGFAIDRAAGIFARMGSLTLTDCVVTGNVVNGTGSIQGGGNLYPHRPDTDEHDGEREHCNEPRDHSGGRSVWRGHLSSKWHADSDGRRD